MKEQRLKQACFVKDANRHAKKHGLVAKDVKDLNTFINDKVNKMLNEHDNNLHVMNSVKELSISSSNESIQSIASNTLAKASDSKDRKLAAKK
eukprot:7421004-Ditylum_brightwellii.AAC.2